MKISVTEPIRLAYNPEVYSSFPDIVRCTDDSYLVVYREGDQHHPTASKLVFLRSKDGIVWEREDFASAAIAEHGYVFNCPRFSKIGNTIYLCCDTKSSTKEAEAKWQILMWISTDGRVFIPVDTGISGMVPDKILKIKNKMIMGYHYIEPISNSNNKRLVQMMATSFDGGIIWRDRTTIAVDDKHNFCEGSIVALDEKNLVCYMRNNKSALLKAHYCFSTDCGHTWNKPQQMACMGHRINASIKKKEPYSGLIVGTFRNTINRSVSLFVQNFQRDKFQILTIDTESNDSLWDYGYTGWVENSDGSLMVVYYIKRNKPNPEICLVNVELL